MLWLRTLAISGVGHVARQRLEDGLKSPLSYKLCAIIAWHVILYHKTALNRMSREEEQHFTRETEVCTTMHLSPLLLWPAFVKAECFGFVKVHASSHNRVPV